MVLIKSEIRKNKTSVINGETISANENGIAEVSREMAKLLISEKYSFMGWEQVDVDKIQKVEKSEPIVPVVTDTREPSEIIKEEEEDLNSKIIAEIEEATKDSNGGFDKLKEIAKALEFPEDEWKGHKRRDYLANYLIKKIEG